MQVDHGPPAGREPRAAHGEELAGGDLTGQVELAVGARLATVVALAVVPEQQGRPDLGVEGDVVLAHEVHVLGVRVVPPATPGVGVTGAPRPLDTRREVADHRVEPDVELLQRLLPPAVKRDRDTPVQVTGDRPRTHVLDQVAGEVQHVRPPPGLAGQPLAEHLGECRQVQEHVLGLDELRHLAIDPGPRVDQFGGVELVAAVVALVATGAVITADRAGALNVAIRQRAPGRRADRAGRAGRRTHPTHPSRPIRALLPR